MMQETNIVQQQDCWMLRGVINYQTVNWLCQRGKAIILQQSSVDFDFSEVTRANSVALALMLAWKRYAKQQAKTVKFCHVSHALCEIANLYSVAKLLGL